MKLSWRSVGGFTGSAGAETCELCSEQLPPAQAASLLQHVAAAGFFALPPTLLKMVPQSWDFLQTLRIEDRGRSHTAQFHAAMASAELLQLVELLRTLADPD